MNKFLHWCKSHWPFLAVTLFGALLRFYRLRELTTFGGDQGVDYQFIAKMIVDAQPRLLGPITHVGIFLGPLYYYLLVPLFILFRFDPIAAPFFFALIGSLTVGLVYILARKFLSPTHALYTALFYASSPVIIESSRAASQPHLIPFLAALFLISIIRIIEKQNTRWDGIVLGIVLGSAIQFHYLTFPIYLFFAGIVAWLWLTQKQERKKLLKLTAYCLLLVAILFSPWFLFEFRNHFFISKQIIEFLGAGEISTSPVDTIVRLLDLSWFSVSRLVALDSQFLTVGGLVLIVAGYFSNWRNSKQCVLFLYTLFNLLGIALYKNPLSSHYISAIYPTIPLLFGIGIYSIFSKRIALVIMIAFIVFNLKQYDAFRNHGYTMPEGVNTTIIQEASRIIANDWSDQGKRSFNIANTLDGDTRANPYRYVLSYIERAVPNDVDHYADNELLYLVTDLSVPELLTDSRWEIMSFPVSDISKVGKAGKRVVIYRMTKGVANRNDVREMWLRRETR